VDTSEVAANFATNTAGASVVTVSRIIKARKIRWVGRWKLKKECNFCWRCKQPFGDQFFKLGAQVVRAQCCIVWYDPNSFWLDLMERNSEANLAVW